MDWLDVQLIQLTYIEKLREAQREERLSHLSFETDEQSPVEAAITAVRQIRTWLAGRTQRRAAGDIRPTHAV